MSNDDKKIANLNLLGVFFGLGAFCMPIVLSTVDQIHYVKVINVVAFLCILLAGIFLLISYPITVEKEKISIQLIPRFFKNRIFLIICFFLFFQSAFEAIMNNWTVSYFIQHLQVDQKQALVALSFLVLGMTLMRILTGGVFRKLSPKALLHIAFVLLFLGGTCLYIKQPSPYYMNTFGLFLIGAGLSPGFPVMLGLTSNMFKETSGTAFSFVMFIALTGNIIINYLTGILIEFFGVTVFVYIIFAMIIFMIALYSYIKNEKKVLT